MVPKRSQFTNESENVYISFSEDPRSPTLCINARNFIKDGQPVLGVMLGADKSLDDRLYQWSKEWAKFDTKADFESRVVQLLMAHIQRDNLGKLKSEYYDGCSSVIDAQRTLMDNLLKLSCMWSVWSCGRFYMRTARDPTVYPSSHCYYQAIHDYLRLHAGEAISIFERHALESMEKVISQTQIRKKDQPAWSTLNVSLWVTLWQLILIYRRTLGHLSYDGSTNAVPASVSGTSGRGDRRLGSSWMLTLR